MFRQSSQVRRSSTVWLNGLYLNTSNVFVIQWIVSALAARMIRLSSTCCCCVVWDWGGGGVGGGEGTVDQNIFLFRLIFQKYFRSPDRVAVVKNPTRETNDLFRLKILYAFVLIHFSDCCCLYLSKYTCIYSTRQYEVELKLLFTYHFGRIYFDVVCGCFHFSLVEQ